jgi:outer membrane protein
MKIKNFISILIISIFGLSTAHAIDSRAVIGIVNFMTVITDSKYGKNEQEQLENIKKQWTTLIEETDKELKEISDKLEDQEYLDGLSPEAEDELKTKKQNLMQDISKYQNQLYQIMNQANYFFIQKMSQNITVASEKVAQDKKLDLVLNKEACFYTSPKIDITTLVITEMDKNYDNEVSKNEASKNEAIKDLPKKEQAKAEASKIDTSKKETTKAEATKEVIKNEAVKNEKETVVNASDVKTDKEVK